MTIQLGVVFSITLVEANAAPSGNFSQPKIFSFVYYIIGTGMVSLATVIWRDYLIGKHQPFRTYLEKRWRRTKGAVFKEG